MKKASSIASMLLGIVFCLFLTLARAPALYNGLWEDEIHYNKPIFLSPTFHSFRSDVGFMMRPLLDFAMRKWIWFSQWGLTPSEQSLSLVSYIYSFAHLLLWLCVPWTPYMSLRLIAILLLGASPLESNISAEAQGYSFISLAPSLLFFAFMWSCQSIRQKKNHAAGLIWIVAMAIDLNSHYFAWPFWVLFAFIFGFYVAFDDQSDYSHKKDLLQLTFVGLTIVVLCSLVINKPSLYCLLVNTPSGRSGFRADWITPLHYLQQSWNYLSLPRALYIFFAIFVWIHPDRIKRYLGDGAFITITVIKYAVIFLMVGKSSYAVADRYLVMFIAPSLMVFALGIESFVERCSYRIPKVRGLMLSGALLVVILCGPGWATLKNVIPEACQGFAKIRETPANYSFTFQFFEKVKSFHQPTLILSNHCWASDIPAFYMGVLGQKPSAPYVVLDTNGSCETSSAKLYESIQQFTTTYPKNTLTVYFFETEGGLIPCNLGVNPLAQMKDHLCIGITTNISGNGIL